MPAIQTWIIRIILIVPVYALSAATAMLIGPKRGVYLDMGVSVYESFAVYCLLNLILEYSGGETDCVYAIENEGPVRMPPPFCCMKPRPRNAKLIRFCHKGVIQFVITRPIMGVFDVVAFALGAYYQVWYQVIEAIIYNFSYGGALFGLILFYQATKKHIRRFRPGFKIAAVKTLIVVGYYQTILVKAAKTDDEQFLWKNMLLSVEMLIWSIIFCCCFPVSEFALGIPERRVMVAIRDLFSLRDMIESFQNNFKNEYRDYSLQRNENEVPSDRIRTFFSRTDHVALEAAERYRGRSKRLAFNSLLRGTRPVTAGLRKKRFEESIDEAEEEQEETWQRFEDNEISNTTVTNPAHSDKNLDVSSAPSVPPKRPIPLINPPPEPSQCNIQFEIKTDGKCGHEADIEWDDFREAL